MPQPPLDQVPLDGTAHGFAHDETRTRRGTTPPRSVRVPGVSFCLRREGHLVSQMYDQKRASSSAPSSYCGREVLAPPHPILGRQHYMTCALRRTGGRGPCRDAPRGWHGLHGCAYAAGNRASWRGGGCSAGRCACSLGGSRNAWCLGGDVRGASLGCHRAPTKLSRYASGAPLFDDAGRPGGLRPRRQAATAIDNSTLLRYAWLCRRVKPSPAANAPATPAEHAVLAHVTFAHTPVDNDLNDVGRAYYRCWTLAPSDPTPALPSSCSSREPRLRGIRRCPLHHPSEPTHRARERAPWLM